MSVKEGTKPSSFKIRCMVPTIEGNFEDKMVTVSFGNVILNPEKETYNTRFKYKQNIKFKVKIPDYVYELLVGEEFMGSMGSTRDYKDLKKTISSDRLEWVTNYLNQLYSDYVFLYKLTHGPKSKKILIDFDHKYKQDITGTWLREKIGDEVQSKLRYMVVLYSSQFKRYFDINYNRIPTHHHNYKWVTEMTMIDWTQEREDALKDMAEKYNQLNTKLDKFFDSVDEKSFDNLILAGGMNLLYA